MSYATLQQLTDRYGADLLRALTDRATPPSGEIDAALVAGALADAAAEIDGHLDGRYALPLAEVPPLLRDIALALAIWKLHRFTPDAKIEADWREALRKLGEIARGAIRLPVPGVALEDRGGTGARITDRERPLTAENLRSFI